MRKRVPSKSTPEIWGNLLILTNTEPAQSQVSHENKTKENKEILHFTSFLSTLKLPRLAVQII